MQQWETLFNKAVKQLEGGKLPKNSWSFGGGTALMLMFNHRHSKDIDIFLPDPQLLPYVSPRVNDGAGDSLDYEEQAKYTRLYLPEGEIDFIASPPITPLKPDFKKIGGIYANVENPVEIVAKKMFHRADSFKPRDLFDLAIVYDRRKDDLLKIAPLLASKLEILSDRINQLEAYGELEASMQEIEILDGGRKVRGHELNICRKCLAEMSLRKDRSMGNALGR